MGSEHADWLNRYMQQLVGATITGAGMMPDGAPWVSLQWSDGRFAGRGCRAYVLRDQEGNGPGWLSLPEFFDPDKIDENVAEEKRRDAANAEWISDREKKIRTDAVDDRLGRWKIWQTGGGCMAYSITPAEGWYLLLTDDDAGIDFEADTPVMLGLYRDDGEGDDNDIRDFDCVSDAIDFVESDAMKDWLKRAGA